MRRKALALLSDSDVLGRLASVILTMPSQKAYIFLNVDEKQSEERVTPQTITGHVDFLARVLEAFPRRPYKEPLIVKAFKRYRSLSQRGKHDAWCAEEGQKLHMVWRWIWTSFKRSPAQFKNDEVKRPKRILAGGSDSISGVPDDSNPRRINVVADDMEELSDESQSDDGVELVANASEDESRSNTSDIAEVAAPPTRRQLRAHISIASSELV